MRPFGWNFRCLTPQECSSHWVIRNIKVHYRARQLSCTILCLDSGKTYEVNILATIHMLAEASKAVKANSIVHCFRHAGFAAAEEPEADDLDVGDPGGTDNVEDLMHNLHSGGVNVTATMTFRTLLVRKGHCFEREAHR